MERFPSFRQIDMRWRYAILGSRAAKRFSPSLTNLTNGNIGNFIKFLFSYFIVMSIKIGAIRPETNGRYRRIFISGVQNKLKLNAVKLNVMKISLKKNHH